MSNLSLNLNGDFYPDFTGEGSLFSAEDRQCIEGTVDRLRREKTSASRPGMLLGKIQSGKTKTFLGIIALAFDNEFDIAIILTKGTKALAKQTFQRVRRDFSRFWDEDKLRVFDILDIPSKLTGYELGMKLVLVCKKQSDNLDRLDEMFRTTYPDLASKRVLLVDDEADYASIGFRRSKENGLQANTTTSQIDTIRDLLGHSAFLQVTATPYALYLQPEDISVGGISFKPVRPAFTVLVPVSAKYIGSSYYFDTQDEEDEVASFIYKPVGIDELQILKKQDRRRFRVEECLTSPAIGCLRSAVCNFIAGGVIRRLQASNEKGVLKKFSFLVHTEAGKDAHSWQEAVVTELNTALREAARIDSVHFTQLMELAYEDLAPSIKRMGHYLPSRDMVIAAARKAMLADWLMITKVNSERQVGELLDDEGQLQLRTPLNLFIGGQILDRGLTISNLIGFFYGRRPNIYQQDTVLQHSRMFGFRPPQDLAVTRFYTEPQIYGAMRRIHESDVALREAFERDPDHAVTFIQGDAEGRVIPCSPNKILVSDTTTIRPFKRILPVGFQTGQVANVRNVTAWIDERVDALNPSSFEEPFLISTDHALELLRKIEPTLVMEEGEGYTFDWNSACAALRYMSGNRGKVWCLVRQDRNIQRRLKPGSHATYADAPDSAKTEGVIARKYAIDSPMLMLIRQNGKIEQGWRGAMFYWPVIVAQKHVPTAIFAHRAST